MSIAAAPISAEPVDFEEKTPLEDATELVLSTSADIDGLRPDWVNLEHRAAGHVFQSWAWVSQWHTHIGAARAIEPFIVMASRRGGGLVALLPMGIETRGHIRKLVWLGAEHADYKGLLLDKTFLARMTPRITRSLLEAACRMAPNIDVVQLLEMPATLEDGSHPLLCYPNHLSPMGSHSMSLGTDFDTFFKARRGASSRKKLRQKTRRLAAAHGEARMEIAASTTQRGRIITALIDQKRSRLAEMGVGDVFADGDVRAFYRSMAENHPGICQLSAYMAGDTITAANWGLVWNGRYYYVLSTMADGDMRAFSPGQLHLTDLIEWSIDNGLSTFDFTAGDEGYKDEWCDTVMPLFDIHFGLTMKGRITAFALSVGRRAKRAIKQDERLWKAAKNLRKLVYRFRTQTAW